MYDERVFLDEGTQRAVDAGDANLQEVNGTETLLRLRDSCCLREARQVLEARARFEPHDCLRIQRSHVANAARVLEAASKQTEGGSGRSSSSRRRRPTAVYERPAASYCRCGGRSES